MSSFHKKQMTLLEKSVNSSEASNYLFFISLKHIRQAGFGISAVPQTYFIPVTAENILCLPFLPAPTDLPPESVSLHTGWETNFPDLWHLKCVLWQTQPPH